VLDFDRAADRDSVRHTRVDQAIDNEQEIGFVLQESNL
jgi:hypothetical protein